MAIDPAGLHRIIEGNIYELVASCLDIDKSKVAAASLRAWGYKSVRRIRKVDGWYVYALP